MRTPGRIRGQAIGGTLLSCLTLLLLAAPASAAPVGVGHSGWFWGDPRPQGHTLTGLDFAGGRGYAAGAFGTLLRTDDAGATWLGIPTGITDPLRRVRAVNADTVVIGGGCALRRSDDGGQSFSRLPWTASDRSCPSPIVSFHFPSPVTGYLLTEDGSVLRTDDGGQTFSRRTSVPGSGSAGGSRKPTDIFFTGADTGVAITGTGSEGKIFRTTDGANSWAEVDSRPTALRGLFFTDPAIGYAVGEQTTLLQTVDGGATWSPRSLAGAPSGLTLTSLDCADASTCLISEATGARILRTSDGGATAEAITPSTQAIFAVAFASLTRAVAVGVRGATVVSDSGGITWSPVGGSISGRAFGPVRATSARLASAGGEDGALARTVDGGNTWTSVGVPTTVAVRDAVFLTETLGFALDAEGAVFKTANGGGSWTILNTGTAKAPRAIVALNSDDVLLAGPRGIRRSTDGGASFAAVGDRDVRRATITGLDSAGDTLAAYGPKTVAVSTNGGASWARVKLPRAGRRSSVRPSDAEIAGKAIYMVADSRVWKTTSRGRSWQDLAGVGTDKVGGISFSSAAAGYLSAHDSLGRGGYAYRTTNGGKTWSPQLIAAEAVSVWDAGQTAFAGTATGAFFATTTGGQAGKPTQLSIAAPKRRGSSGARRGREVEISGRLTPPEGGEEIFVSIRKAGASKWRTTAVTAASNGEFTASFEIKAASDVVAQWRGDDDRAGTGSKPLRVKPPKR